MIDVFGRGGSLKSSWYGDCLPSRDFPMLVDLYRRAGSTSTPSCPSGSASATSRRRSRRCTRETCCARWSCSEARAGVTAGRIAFAVVVLVSLVVLFSPGPTCPRTSR